jgi:hypothetical protein
MHPVLIVLLILPLLAVGILLIVRRSRSLSQLVPALVLSGIATALTTALLAFTTSTVPIAAFARGPGAWFPLVGETLMALYIGFGIGAVIAELIGVPYQLIANRTRP